MCRVRKYAGPFSLCTSLILKIQLKLIGGVALMLRSDSVPLSRVFGAGVYFVARAQTSRCRNISLDPRLTGDGVVSASLRFLVALRIK